MRQPSIYGECNWTYEDDFRPHFQYAHQVNSAPRQSITDRARRFGEIADRLLVQARRKPFPETHTFCQWDFNIREWQIEDQRLPMHPNLHPPTNTRGHTETHPVAPLEPMPDRPVPHPPADRGERREMQPEAPLDALPDRTVSPEPAQFRAVDDSERWTPVTAWG